MRSASVELDAHVQLHATSLATAWRIERRDGVVFRFTTDSRSVPVDFGIGEGVQFYKSSAGFARTNIESDVEMNVSNLDVRGVFDDDAIKENELRAGLFDFADVRIFIYNHRDTSMGVIKMFRGVLGEVRVSDNGWFEVEFRSMEQALTRRIGELYSKDCRADLGDARCRLPILPDVLGRQQTVAVGEFYRVSTLTSPSPDGTSFDYEDRIYRVTVAGTTASVQPEYDTTVGENTYDGTAELVAEEAWSRACEVVSVVDDRRVFSVFELFPDSGGVTPGRDFFPDDSMNGGGLTFESGDNAGVTIEVRDFEGGATQQFTLFLETPFPIQVGDRLRVYRGCDKVFATCRDIFDNKDNFVGEPYVPGEDFLSQYPDAR